jgi:serine/threonine protein phosphatase PrpC
MGESIGVGPLQGGAAHPSGKVEYLAPYPPGTPIGQHLAVERLTRLADRRQLYLVNNTSPKWNRRKCWKCGNKYSPNEAQSCIDCLTPLKALRFMMSGREDPALFEGFQELVQARIECFGLITPVALLYKDARQVAVYHDEGQAFFIDEPSPLLPEQLCTYAQRLNEILSVLHEHGAHLRPLQPHHVLVMPDGTVRLFDVDAFGLCGNRDALEGMSGEPIRQDVVGLCRLLLPYVPAEHDLLQELFGKGVEGAYAEPASFGIALQKALFKGANRPTPVRAAAFRDVGLVRVRNEDNLGWKRISDRATVYCVADGMGGHQAGEVASRLAVDATLHALAHHSPPLAGPETFAPAFEKAVQHAARIVIAEADRMSVKMGCTVVLAAIIDRKKVVVANAGDSRAYLLSQGKLTMLSRDHTVGAALVEQGKLKPEDARNHPKGNVLTSSVGGDDDPEIDVKTVEAQLGDRLLLCTDGLWAEVAESEIVRILSSVSDRRDAVKALVKAAIDRGAPDNVAIIVADVQ